MMRRFGEQWIASVSWKAMVVAMVRRAFLIAVTAWLFAFFSPVFGQPGSAASETLSGPAFECVRGQNCCYVRRTNISPYRYTVVCDPVGTPSRTDYPLLVFTGSWRVVAGWMANAEIPGWESWPLAAYSYPDPPPCDRNCDTTYGCCAIGWSRATELYSRAYDGAAASAVYALIRTSHSSIRMQGVSPEYCHAWWNYNVAEGNPASPFWISSPTPRGAIPCTVRDVIGSTTLTVRSSGATEVVIAANPPGMGGTTNYVVQDILRGTEIMLIAPPRSGNADFVRWRGCDRSSDNACTVVMSTPKTVTAVYSTPDWALRVRSTGATEVVIEAEPRTMGGETDYVKRRVPRGTEITLTAPQTSGNARFEAWSGCTQVSANVCTVVMSTGDEEATAAYVIDEHDPLFEDPDWTACIEEVCPVCRGSIHLLGVAVTAECQRCIDTNRDAIERCVRAAADPEWSEEPEPLPDLPTATIHETDGNDKVDGATPTPGTATLVGTISPAGDRDHFVFDAPHHGEWTIVVEASPSGVELSLRVRRLPHGGWLPDRARDDAGRLVVDLPEPGRYVLQVSARLSSMRSVEPYRLALAFR